MKIKEIHQREPITEESWADIAKAAYAGATGQKDLFGKEEEKNKYNAEIEKSQAGQDWLVKNFTKRANTANPPTADNYRKIAQQLLNQMISNQTGVFKNLLMTMGLKDRPTTNIETFINDIKKSFGNDLKSFPELNRILDNLGRTYDAVLDQSAQHKVGQSADPELQRVMAGFASIWYNLPKIMKDAIDRNIQSSRYGEQWIDAGNGVDIKPATIFDRSISARYNNEVFYYRHPNWYDSVGSPTPADIQNLLIRSLEAVNKKIKVPNSPSTAGGSTSSIINAPGTYSRRR